MVEDGFFFYGQVSGVYRSLQLFVGDRFADTLDE